MKAAIIFNSILSIKYSSFQNRGSKTLSSSPPKIKVKITEFNCIMTLFHNYFHFGKKKTPKPVRLLCWIKVKNSDRLFQNNRHFHEYSQEQMSIIHRPSLKKPQTTQQKQQQKKKNLTRNFQTVYLVNIKNAIYRQ